MQPAIVVHASVATSNLYRVLVRYHNPTGAPIAGTVSLATRSEGKGGAIAAGQAADCLDCKWHPLPLRLRLVFFCTQHEHGVELAPVNDRASQHRIHSVLCNRHALSFK